MARVYRIYDVHTGRHIQEVPLVPDDPNHGLPDWFFDRDDVVELEVDRERDTVEWWPGIGPAPHWSARWSEVETDPTTPLREWYRRTY